MKKDSMIGRRLYAFVIDVLIFVCMAFLIDGVGSTPIAKATTNIDAIYTSFHEHNDRYNDLSVEYGIYIKGADGKLTFNDKATEAQQTAFLNDPEIIALREIMQKESTDLIVSFVVRVSISMAVASFIVFFIVPLCIRRGRTVGKLIAKLNIVNKDYSYIKWYQLLLRYFISTITNIYLFVLTLGIVPLIILLLAINQKENQAIYDLITRTYIIDGKIPAHILKEKNNNEENIIYETH